ncbi:MAG: hypothetical protein KHY83_00580 [Coriobacteriia bacterium]|nr:hypothetical protein [Coriobacteriia bacterium]MBS5477150.1 hypothetical protein [Coriobacteriia bacterium]
MADGNNNARFVGSPNDGDKIPHAPRGMRYVGFCRQCGQFVEVGPDFSCKSKGHPRQSIAVALLLGLDEPKPHMPSLNIGALFMPALWGPVHGQWFMILFYPLWLVLDNLIYAAVHGQQMAWLAAFAAIGTAAFTIYYAMRANVHGYIRVASEKSLEEYLATERKWSILFVLIGVAFIAFATWYNLAIRPGLSV